MINYFHNISTKSINSCRKEQIFIEEITHKGVVYNFVAF